jgi:diguanylate cyclase (GGDEF)-like protein
VFRYIGHKIVTAVGVVVVGGLFALTLFYTTRQEESILAQNEQAMRKLTESVIQALQTVMIAGYADIAQVFADKLKTVQEVADFRIVRINGHEAFLDNITLNEVNRRLGDEEFIPKEAERAVQVFAPDDLQFRRAIDGRTIVALYETASTGERFLTFLAPILNQQRCYKCHGQANPVRGVLKLTTSLRQVQEDIRHTWMQSFIILGLALASTLGATWYLIRRSIVDHIVAVSRAMQRVSAGDLRQEVPVLGDDEVSVMARSFNRMTRELLDTYSGLEKERGKLTTIIQSAREGIVVTNAAGEVVLVNPAAEFLLQKDAANIVASGFLDLLDDPSTMRGWLDVAAPDRPPEVVGYKDHILAVHVETIRDAAGAVVGSAALIRDVTEEKRLEDRLRLLSVTDALTGLRNRRFLDQTLPYEVERARRYGVELSVLMFDVDHFKRFNDEHGHDTGDRVLKAVAEAARRAVRRVDIPCRFGGEEFLIILPDAAEAGARHTAERLRRTVEETRIDGLAVTVSVGLASYTVVRPATWGALVEAADKALYVAKAAGRNRVAVAEPPPQAATGE